MFYNVVAFADSKMSHVFLSVVRLPSVIEKEGSYYLGQTVVANVMYFFGLVC